MQGPLLKPQSPSPGEVWGRKEGWRRALASSEALLGVQQVLCEHEKPAPKTVQDTRRASTRGQQTHDMGHRRHHLQSRAQHVGRTAPEGREQQARKWMWMVLGGASGPATPSVGKLTGCRS